MSGARWSEIAAALRADIVGGVLKPGERLPTEDEMAALWRVSRMTAHRALDELHREGLLVRRRRVGTTVAARPPLAATDAAASVRTHALLVFHGDDYPQVGYVNGFQAGVGDGGRLLLFDTRNAAEREVQILEALGPDVDAVCCFPTGDPTTTRLLNERAARGGAVVCLDRVPDGLTGVDVVLSDNYGSTRDALRTLTARGHRRIAFLTTDNRRVSSVRERHEAYEAALAEIGQPTDGLVRVFRRGAGYDFEAFVDVIHAALAEMLARPEDGSDAGPPTALVCLEDYFLWAALEACDRLGVAVPDDLEILSFSDCPPLAPRLTRGVHRLVQRAGEMGRIAAHRLARRLDGEPLPAEIVRVPADLHPARLGPAPERRRP